MDVLVDSITLTLASGASTTLSHGILENGAHKVPDRVMPTKASGIRVTAVTSTQVTFNNPTAGSLTATFYIQRTHAVQMDPDNQVTTYWAGIDSSGGSVGTFQQSYDADAAGQVVVALGGGTQTGIAFRDSAGGLGSDLFEVIDSGDTVQYLGVDTLGPKTDRGLTLTNSTTTTAPSGTARIRANGGNLQVSNSTGAYKNVLGAGDVTLSVAYGAGSAGPQSITLDATRLGITLDDAANVGGDLLSVTDGTNPWLAVRNNAVRVGADTIQFRELPGGGPFSLAVVTPAAANTAGYTLTVSAGNGAASDNAAAGGAGATMTVAAGDGGAGGAAQVAGAGADLVLQSGTAGANNGGGGGAAGNILANIGSATGAGANGIFRITLDASSTNTQLDVLNIRRTTSGTPAVGLGAAIAFSAETSAGAAEDNARIVVISRTVAAGSPNGVILFQNYVSAGGAMTSQGHCANQGLYGASNLSIGTVSATGVTTTLFQASIVSSQVNFNSASASQGGFTFTGVANTSGARGFMTMTPTSNTGVTAATETSGFTWATHTMTWASNTTVATQREIVFNAPTYAHTTAGGNITTAATVAITGAPIQGSNTTLGTTLAFWVQAGIARFDGRVIINVPNSAPTDADLQNSSMGWYLTEATPAVNARIKKSDGTFLTLTITNGASPTLA